MAGLSGQNLSGSRTIHPNVQESKLAYQVIGLVKKRTHDTVSVQKGNLQDAGVGQAAVQEFRNINQAGRVCVRKAKTLWELILTMDIKSINKSFYHSISSRKLKKEHAVTFLNGTGNLGTADAND